MKYKYSPDFGAAFRELSPQAQNKVKAIDRRIVADDLSDFDRQGWAYFVNLDDDHVAIGNYREPEDLFYWWMIVSPDTKPIIL